MENDGSQMRNVFSESPIEYCLDCGRRLGDGHGHEKPASLMSVSWKAVKVAASIAGIWIAFVFLLLVIVSFGLVLLKGLVGLWREFLPLGC